MAGEAADLSTLLALLAALREDDYATLASRGLARRAQKEAASARYVGWEDGRAVVAVGPHTVRVPPAGPARATCSCPSAGVCQHVIAACLALVAGAVSAPPAADAMTTATRTPAELAGEVSPAAAPAPGHAPPQPPARSRGAGAAGAVPGLEAWTAVEPAALRRWAGSEAWTGAVELARTATVSRPAGRQGTTTTVVTFAGGDEARLPAGAPLDGLITSAPARRRRRVIAAAVLATRGAGWAAEAAAPAPWAVPVELLRGVQEALASVVRLGVNRATSSTLARLEVLGVRCRAAGAYRPARELAACASEIRWLLDRDARGDPERLLERLAALHALLAALARAPGAPDAELVGSARTDYEERPALDLVGCGAWRWRTGSGFHGLTVLLWDAEGEQFLSWSDSRPVGSGDGFDPARRFEEAGPWAGAPVVATLAGAAFRLERPRVSAQRRVSSSASSRVSAIAGVAAEDLPPAETSWEALRARAARSAAAALGLRRAVALDAVVRLAPHQARAPRFDEITQCQVWPLVDAAGDELVAVLPFARETATAIRWLETRRLAAGESLVGLYRGGPGESFFPIATIGAGPAPEVRSLGFAALDEPTGWLQRLLGRRPGRAWSRPVASLDLADDPEAEPGPLADLLRPARGALLAAAELGLAARGMPLDWEATCDRLASAGLIRLSGALRPAFAAPERLLQAVYLVALHAQAGGLAAAADETP
jgi:hypothetical protein